LGDDARRITAFVNREAHDFLGQQLDYPILKARDSLLFPWRLDLYSEGFALLLNRGWT
jgi:hypothetical protein